MLHFFFVYTLPYIFDILVLLMIEQHANLTEKFIKKWFWLYLFSFIIAPIWYIVKIIIAGELSVSEVGVLYGIISLITLFSAYNDLWLTDSINYFVPKFVQEKRFDKVKSILVYIFIAQLITGISIASFFFFWADYISSHYFESPLAANSLKIFAFFFLGINVFQVISTFFMAVQNTFYNKLIELFRMVFILLSTFFIFFFDLGSLTNYSYTWIIGLYIGIIFALFLFIKRYFTPYFKKEKIIWSSKLFIEIFKYSLSIFLGIQASVILSQMDIQLILALLGTEKAWYYTTYLSIIGIPFLLIGPIFGFLYPLFSELESKKEYDKIRLVKSIFQKNFIAVSIALSIFFFFFAKQIVFILFGEKFLPSWEILQFSILFLSFNFLLQFNFNIMAGIGKVQDRVKIIGIAILTNAILNTCMILFMGINGAALATGIWWILIWILSEYYLWKQYRVSFPTLYIIKDILLLWCFWFLLFRFSEAIFLENGRLFSFWFLGLLSIVYFVFFLALHYKEFMILLNEIKKIRLKNI